MSNVYEKRFGPPYGFEMMVKLTSELLISKLQTKIVVKSHTLCSGQKTMQDGKSFPALAS